MWGLSNIISAMARGPWREAYYGEKKRNINVGLANFNKRRSLDSQISKENNPISTTPDNKSQYPPNLIDNTNTRHLPRLPTPVEAPDSPTVTFKDYPHLKKEMETAKRQAEKAEKLAKSYKIKYYNSNRRAARATAAQAKCKKRLADLYISLQHEKREGAKLLKEASQNHSTSDKELKCKIAHLERQAAVIKQKYLDYRDEVRLLRVRVARAPAVCQRKVKKALWNARKMSFWDQHGRYSDECRELMRELRVNGVPLCRIGGVIKSFANTFGLEFGRIPSERTIERCIDEGGIAAQIQMVEEMLGAGGTHAETLLRDES